MDNKWEEVYLSTVEFAQAPSQPVSDTTPTTTEPESGGRGQGTYNAASSGSGRSNLHERFPIENIGEELRPNAAIWQMYREEAQEHDEELVNGQNQNLDTMLLFAALFSAVLSAFLIESKKLLQQDPADASLKLLLLIAQSQQRVEQGTPQLLSAPIEHPNFSSSQSARWINGLWFMSLALSLSAALVALLAKEWLAAFTASPPRPAYEYTLLRQARLVGLIEWNALPIMDLLPSMLHLSLVLFLCGLIIYICTLDDSVIAVSVALVAGATLLFYLVTAYLGATRKFCPFVTRISKYTRRVLKSCFREWMERRGYANIHIEPQNNNTTDEDLRALVWLAQNTRDPAIIDGICLSLAGLRLPTTNPGMQGVPLADAQLQSTATPADPEVTRNGDVGIFKTHGNSDAISIRYKLVHGLYDVLYARLSQVVNQPLLTPNAQQGGQVVRYACALPHLVQYLETYSDQGLVGETNSRRMVETPARVVHKTIDDIWRSACPSLSPDSYALLTSTSLRLVTALAVSHHKQRSPLQYSHEATGLEPLSALHAPTERGTILTQNHVQISLDSQASPKVSLFDLRARYSLILCRAAHLLRSHTDGHAHVGASALIYLLKSISNAAQQENLVSNSYLSTHHPQSRTGPAPRVWLQVDRTSDHYCVDPDSIGDERGLLVGLLRLYLTPETQSTPDLEYATGEALNTIVPIILKQWLSTTLADGAGSACVTEQFQQTAFANWPQVTTTADWQTQLVLRIAIVTMPYAQQSGIKQLPELAISALYTRLKTNPDRDRAYDTFCSQEHLMNQLVDLVCTHIQCLGQFVLQSFMNIFLLDIQDQIYFMWPGVSTNKLPAFLKILSRIQGQASELQVLLDVLQVNIHNYPAYLRLFTNSGEGFSALLEIGRREEYQPMVAKCVVNVFEIATKKKEVIAAQAIPRFFDAVSFALTASSLHKKHTVSLLASMCKLLPSLRSFPHDIVYKVAAHPATAIIIHALWSMNEPAERINLLVELEEIQSQLYVDNLPLEGLAQLFGQHQGVSENCK